MITKNEQALIFMSQFEFMTSSKFEQVLQIYKEPSKIFTDGANELLRLKSVLDKHYELFVQELKDFNFDKFIKPLEQRGINIITIYSQNYPKKYLNLKNPPYVLYYVGNINLLNTKCVAIVGTRVPTTYGKIITEKFAKAIASAGVTVVSGLAMGIDKIAHESALEVGGNTIAILGGGFDHIFPAMNVNLAREIANKGLIMTEYYLTQKPAKYTFPTRNRLIAAISNLVLIPEAKTKSGSLYTKEYASDLGIDTYAIPGNITSQNSSATNHMIKTGTAGCVTCPEDILIELGINTENKKEKSKKKQTQLTVEQASIYKLLEDGEKDFDFLQQNTNYSVQTLNYNLTTMEISGIIKKLAGNTYVIIDN